MAHDIGSATPEQNAAHFQGWNEAQEEKIHVITSAAFGAVFAMVIVFVAVSFLTFTGEADGSQAFAYGAAAGSFAGFWTFSGLVIFRIKD